MGKKGLALLAVVNFWLVVSGCFALRREAGGGRGFRSNINLIVAPRKSSSRGVKAALAFSAPMPYPSAVLASECMAIFQRAFVEQRVFKVITRFSAQGEPVEALMELAREKGFDFLVQGTVTDFFLPRGPRHPGLRFPSKSTT
ncbi:MAG: hypothetical protein AB1611_14995 [bacterium]